MAACFASPAGKEVWVTEQDKTVEIEWSDELTLGHPVMDQQHRELVNLFNEASHSIATIGCQRARPKLDRLIEQTMLHFDCEEAAMAAHQYPDFQAHCDEHTRLALDIHEFRSQYVAGKFHQAEALIQYLRVWLVDHIVKSDRQFALHVFNPK